MNKHRINIADTRYMDAYMTFEMLDTNTYYVQQKVNDIYSHTSLNNFVLLKMLHTSRNE